MTTEDQPWGPLLEEARGLPDGPARLALLEEAARLADSHGDAEAGFRVRHPALMRSAVTSGRPEKMLTAFLWCLAQCDRAPSRRDPAEFILGHLAQVLRILRESPRIPRPQIGPVLDDLFTRFRRAGRPLWPLFEQGALIAVMLGDLDEAADRWRERERHRRGLSAHDRAVSQGYEVEYHLRRGDDAAALATAEPLLARQLQTDSDPHYTVAHLMVPLLKAGRVAEAMSWQPAGYRHFRTRIICLGEVGKHAEFLALTDNVDEAVRLVEAHAAWLLASHEAIDLYRFNLAARFVFDRLREREPVARLRLPKELACHRPDGAYDLDVLVAHFDGEARRIAGEYDARNGNDFFGRTTLAAADDLRRWVTPCPIPKAALKGPKGNK